MYVSKEYVLWFLWLLWGRRLNSWVFILILFFFPPQLRIGNIGYGQSWWWTGKPGMLQSMGSQRVGHDWATELYWTYDKRFQVCCKEFHTGHGHAQCKIFHLIFFGDKNEVRNLGNSTSDSSETLLQRGQWRKVNIEDFGERGVQCNQALILQKVCC